MHYLSTLVFFCGSIVATRQLNLPRYRWWSGPMRSRRSSIPIARIADEAKRRSAELRDDDRVLCWIRGYSDGGAIPIASSSTRTASSATPTASSSTTPTPGSPAASRRR